LPPAAKTLFIKRVLDSQKFFIGKVWVFNHTCFIYHFLLESITEDEINDCKCNKGQWQNRLESAQSPVKPGNIDQETGLIRIKPCRNQLKRNRVFAAFVRPDAG
jgi:hypothetical protein